ncbi:hypothetical protein D3C81_2204080 [compost metagenome]
MGGAQSTFFKINEKANGVWLTAVTAQRLPKIEPPIYKATIAGLIFVPNNAIAKGKPNHAILT